MIAGLLALLAVINSAYAPVSYSCNGSTAAFTVNFPYLAQTDLVVTTTTGAGASTTLVLTTDYSLSVTSTQSTATLTLNSPSTKCPTGNTLKIARNTSPTQPTSFKSQINFSPSLHETAFDRITMITQERSATAGSILDSSLASAYSGTGSCSANTWASVLSRNTAPTCTQPAFSNLSGVATSGQVPSLDASKITTGILPQSLGGTGAGALTCTGAAVTSNGTAYSCSPVVGFLNSINNWVSSQTFSGGLTFSTGSISSAGAASLASLTLTTPLAAAQGGTGVATAAANLVLATPNGSSGALSPRALVAADMPSLPASQIGSGTLAAARLGLPTCSTSGINALFFDGTTITCPATAGGTGASLAANNTFTGGNTFTPSTAGTTAVTGTGNGSANGGVFTAGTGAGTNYGVIGQGGASGAGTGGKFTATPNTGQWGMEATGSQSGAGTGVVGGTGALLTGGAGNTGAGGNAGLGALAHGGAGAGSNNNGTGLVANSGTGGTGAGAAGYGIQVFQSNSIKEHINMSPVNTDPSSPDPGGIWTLEDTVNATALKFRSTGIGAVTPKTYIMAPLVAASTSSFTSSTTVTLPSNNMTCVCGSTVSAQACATGISGTTLTITRTGTGVATYLCFMTQ